MFHCYPIILGKRGASLPHRYKYFILSRARCQVGSYVLIPPTAGAGEFCVNFCAAAHLTKIVLVNLDPSASILAQPLGWQSLDVLTAGGELRGGDWVRWHNR